MKAKVFVLAIVAVLGLSFDAESKAATVSVSCSPANSGPSPSSFQLLKQGPGETSYTVAVEQATCVFNNVQIVDTGETCFKFAAKANGQTTTRNWSRVCYDPTQLPVLPPEQLKVQ